MWQIGFTTSLVFLHDETSFFYFLFFILFFFFVCFVLFYCMRYQKYPFMVNEIQPGLYISDYASTFNMQKLKELGVTHILSLIVEYTPIFPNVNKTLYIHFFFSSLFLFIILMLFFFSFFFSFFFHFIFLKVIPIYFFFFKLN